MVKSPASLRVHRRKTFLITALLIALFFVSMGPGAATAEPDDGGTVVILMATGPPRTLNSAVATGYSTGMVSAQLFASPLRYDDNWQPQPYLAEKWKMSEDGRSLTLNLVKGATFHDGHPITSDDVAFSIMAAKTSHPFKSAFTGIERVDTPDRFTVIIHLNRPMPAILMAMSPFVMPILPKHVYGDGQDLKTHPANGHPVGSGPFKFVSHVPGESIVLEKNPDFFIPGRPRLDRLVFRIEGDPQVQMIDMERQEAHLLPFFARPEGLGRLSRDPHLSITDRGYQAIGAVNWLAFNLLHPPLDDQRVRQAIAYVVNREFITGFLHEGKSRVATGPITPDNPFYEPDVRRYEPDTAMANALLDKAGYARTADGTRFSLHLDYAPALPSHQRTVALYIKRQLGNVGIHVVVRHPDNFAQWITRVANWDFDMAMDLVSNYGDPVIGVQRTYLSGNIRKGVMWSNTQNYRNRVVDDLLEQAAVETDGKRRKALYSEFQKVVTEDLPVFWINVVSFHTVYNKGLENLPVSIWGVLSPLDELCWESRPAARHLPTPTLQRQDPPIKRIGVRVLNLLKSEGVYAALERLKEPNEEFLDLDRSGRHVIGFTRKGIVFLDNSDQMTPGMDISGILDSNGKRLLPQLLDAAKAKTGGFFKSTGALPHPKTHVIGPMSAWCGRLSADDVICVVEWD